MRHSRIAGRFTCTAILLVTIGGCSSDSTAPPAPTPTTVVATAGMNQSGVVGTLLADQLVVQVLDQNGNMLAGVTVSWAVQSGGGTLSQAQSITGADGSAQTAWTLGPAAGPQSANGSVSGLSVVTFSATAEPGEPSSVLVTPDQVTLDALGANAQLTASLTDANGNTIAGGVFVWASDNATLVSVDGTGIVTAVANGTASITATSGTFQGSAAATVSQVASAVEVEPATVEIPAGGFRQLAATVTDANANEIVGADVGWTSSDNSVVTVSAAGLATGVVEGTSTVTATSGNATQTVAVTVSAAPMDFLPAGNMTVDGTLNVALMTIPAGITITATDDLTINATGIVQIDGNLVGDCVAITLNGSTDINVTGRIANGCGLPPLGDPPALQILGNGAVNFDGAVITGAGDVEISNDLAAPSSGNRSARGPFLAAARSLAGEGCTLVNATVTAGNAADGVQSQDFFTTRAGARGREAALRCSGDAILDGSVIRGGAGGAGAEHFSENTGSARGGAGGEGGRAIVVVRNAVIRNRTQLIGGNGGAGGPGFHAPASPGASAHATGGNGGRGGGASIRVTTVLTSPTRVVLGTIDIDEGAEFVLSVGSGGHGGAAIATGADGNPGQPGGFARAERGNGGAVAFGNVFADDSGSGGIITGLFIDPNERMRVTVGLVVSGDGGDATAVGGRGGDGPGPGADGAKGGNAVVRAGDGGVTSLRDDLGIVPVLILLGAGGDGTYRGGRGGDGASDVCAPGGNGGPGGSIAGQGGGFGGFKEKDLAGTRGPNGSTTVSAFGNGGDGADGFPAGMGGPGGQDGITRTGITPDPVILGSFQPGLDGTHVPCAFTVDVTGVVKSDVRGHEFFLKVLNILLHQLGFEPGRMMTIGAAAPLPELSGSLDADGPADSSRPPGAAASAFGGATVPVAFSLSGRGNVIGFLDVLVTFEGTIELDEATRLPVSYTGDLTVDAENDKLPADPVTGVRSAPVYTITGSVRPPGG